MDEFGVWSPCFVSEKQSDRLLVSFQPWPWAKTKCYDRSICQEEEVRPTSTIRFLMNFGGIEIQLFLQSIDIWPTIIKGLSNSTQLLQARLVSALDVATFSSATASAMKFM